MLPLSPRHFWYHFDDAVIRNDFSMAYMPKCLAHTKPKIHIYLFEWRSLNRLAFTHTRITRHTYPTRIDVQAARHLRKQFFWFAENSLQHWSAGRRECLRKQIKGSEKHEKMNRNMILAPQCEAFNGRRLYLLPLNRTVLFQFSFFFRWNIWFADIFSGHSASAANKIVRCTLELPANNTMQIQLHLHSFTVSTWVCANLCVSTLQSHENTH